MVSSSRVVVQCDARISVVDARISRARFDKTGMERGRQGGGAGRSLAGSRAAGRDVAVRVFRISFMQKYGRLS